MLQLTDPGINAIRFLSSPNASARLQHLPTSLLSDKNFLKQDDGWAGLKKIPSPVCGSLTGMLVNTQ